MTLLIIAVVAGVVALVFFLVLRGGGGGGGGGGFGAGASFPPGTRAFEAEMSLRILAQMIDAREVEIARTTDEAKKADLTRQISNMRKQAEIHRATVAARDVSPGRMSIGVNPDSDTVE